MLHTYTGVSYARLCRTLWSYRPLFLSSFSSIKSPPTPHSSSSTPPSPSSTPRHTKPTLTTTTTTAHSPPEDPRDENTIYELRMKMVKEWEEKSGKKAYAPHQPTSHSLAQFREAFSHLKNGEKAEGCSVSVSG